MDLPSAPRPAYFINTVSSPSHSSPSSPLSTAPPSPTAATRPAFEYPPSSYAPSSAPASRSSSKNPLFKKDLEDRRRRNEGKGFFAKLFADKNSTLGQDLELEESRGRRRRSVSHAEEEGERRHAQAAVHQELERRSTKASNVSEVGSGSQTKSVGWFTKERCQLAVAFASESMFCPRLSLTVSDTRFLVIALVGMNDSATGSNLESMREHYEVSYDEISLVFLATSAGYCVSSISASFFTHHIGVNYTLLVAATALSLGCIALSVAPPFPVFIIALGFMGFGSGIYDAAITTVIAHFESQALM